MREGQDGCIVGPPLDGNRRVLRLFRVVMSLTYVCLLFPCVGAWTHERERVKALGMPWLPGCVPVASVLEPRPPSLGNCDHRDQGKCAFAGGPSAGRQTVTLGCFQNRDVLVFIRSAPFFTAPEPFTMVYFASYEIKHVTRVRAPVCEIGRSLRVGGAVQRTNAETVRVRVATPDRSSMLSFLAQVQACCNPGSIERTSVMTSSEVEHITLSQKSFCSHRSHSSANDGDDVSSYSGSGSDHITARLARRVSNSSISTSESGCTRWSSS